MTWNWIECIITTTWHNDVHSRKLVINHLSIFKYLVCCICPFDTYLFLRNSLLIIKAYSWNKKTPNKQIMKLIKRSERQLMTNIFLVYSFIYDINRSLMLYTMHVHIVIYVCKLYSPYIIYKFAWSSKFSMVTMAMNIW